MSEPERIVLSEAGCCSACGQSLGGWTLVGLHRKNEAYTSTEGYCPDCGQRVSDRPEPAQGAFLEP